MAPFYKIVLLSAQPMLPDGIRSELQKQLQEFGLDLATDVQIISLDNWSGSIDVRGTVGVYLGDSSRADCEFVLPQEFERHRPIIPIVSELDNAPAELPETLSHINAIARDEIAADARIAAAILETLDLMPARRRIFLSYRRCESRDIALQIFDDLSAKQFNVFLDTHEIRPAAHFQEALRHELSDCDVMVMLNTRGYFESRWTVEEFALANLKNAAILNVSWPEASTDPRLSVTTPLRLTEKDFVPRGILSKPVAERVGDAVEKLRSKSVAVRHANLTGSFRNAVDTLDGNLDGPGPMRRLCARLVGSPPLLIYPAVGVPASEYLQRIAEEVEDNQFALLFDHIGVRPHWDAHLDWLGEKVQNFRWIRAASALTDLKAYAGENS